MSAIKIDRGPGENPWLIHASSVAEVDSHLSDTYARMNRLCTAESTPETLDEIRYVRALRDELLDLRNTLRTLDAAA